MITPDIEIYIKNADSQVILTWLENNFDDVEITINESSLANGITLKGTLGKLQQDKRTSIPIVVTPRASGKIFTSIWFQSDKTGWRNDEECAESLLKLFDGEIRCSASGWEETEKEDSEQWWKITRDEKKLIRW